MTRLRRHHGDWRAEFVCGVGGEARETFPAADLVGKFTVLNIGGNKARLIAALHYNRRKV